MRKAIQMSQSVTGREKIAGPRLHVKQFSIRMMIGDSLGCDSEGGAQ